MSVRPFDVCGDLPEGVTVLEASAGTGKTYTIAALAARYVAQGVPLEKLLLVTFTRMATGELRERVRERLVQAERALATGIAQDAVDALLLSADVDRRRARLAEAIAGFDAATIATTHEFCGEMLGSLGVLADVEPDSTFVEDISDLVEEVVDDLYVRRFHRAGMPQFSRAQALQIAWAAINNPLAPVEPAGAPEGSIEAMRVRLARAACQELDRRKRRMALMTYDDLLTRLRDTLVGPHGEEAVRRLRDRYAVVLVDEFQDTDPVQWEIMRTAFGEGATALVLIGDPKQAIYAFRGADVFAYIHAAKTAGERCTLGINWRSDQALLDAYDALFGNAQLGHPGIVYRQARADHQTAGLHGAPDAAALRVRVVNRETVGLTPRRFARLQPAREHIAADLAGDVVRLLESGARFDDGREICPGDIAVLVRTNRNAALVRDALEQVHVPAVINGAGSVFGTAPAREWLRLLEAIERPANPPRAHSAALTTFLGWSTERVAGASDDEWEVVHRRLHHWARVLRVKGVASLMEAITHEEGLPARVLAMADGERRMTDLRHVGELLHRAATTEQLGATALTAWLRQRVEEAADDLADEERSRRLESDAEAVQVLTVHRSKGLEFPVVYYPDLFEPSPTPRDDRRAPVIYHDPDNDDRRTIDVGLSGPQWDAHVARDTEEQRGEDLRLAYVALTRAKHQAVVWWAGSAASRDSALTRLLWFRDGSGEVAPAGQYTPGDADAMERFTALADAAPGRVSVEWAELRAQTPWRGPEARREALAASRFDRPLDWAWRRTSYSDITADAYEARVGSEPEEPVVQDEPAGPAVRGDGELPLATMPAGVEIGTLVHRVFEEVDFADEAGLEALLAEQQARRRIDLGDPARVLAGLRAVLDAELPAGFRLRDVARADRLDEMTFELPLVGGDTPAGELTMDALAAVLRRHDAGPLDGYADRLADPGLRRSVRGYLTGAVDLIVRHEDRFSVIDYKTNWLAPPGKALTAWHYRPEALREEMLHAHYGLQALLYAVALHRFLRWRLPGYDPERNLAGVMYLFIRGMPEAGVFHWDPPAALVHDLSEALDAA